MAKLPSEFVKPPAARPASKRRGKKTSLLDPEAARALLREVVVRLSETEHRALEDARGRSLLFLARRGLESALERFHPFAPTWRWQTRMGMVRWQLDHILVGPSLRASAAWTLDGGASDHVPVLARIQRPAP